MAPTNRNTIATERLDTLRLSLLMCGMIASANMPAQDFASGDSLLADPDNTPPAAIPNPGIPTPPPEASLDPQQFFKDHFFGYEPFYFIAGTESPNARFQISLRYQLLNNEGSLAHHVPPLKGLNLAYTQTSLWDWNAASKPFFDSSYMPELMFLWPRVDRGRWSPRVRLDLQTAFLHESNGKSGLDSRSLNMLYLRPTLTLGNQDRFHVTLSPRLGCYVGGLVDNPDLPDYRGYADLRASAGWTRSIQLAATARLGESFDRGSLQLDLTYPLSELFSGSLSIFLHAQYFTGYGESFLLYNQTSDAFRVGFSIYR